MDIVPLLMIAEDELRRGLAIVDKALDSYVLALRSFRC
jgi:hypothetical protein